MGRRTVPIRALFRLGGRKNGFLPDAHRPSRQGVLSPFSIEVIARDRLASASASPVFICAFIIPNRKNLHSHQLLAQAWYDIGFVGWTAMHSCSSAELSTIATCTTIWVAHRPWKPLSSRDFMDMSVHQFSIYIQPERAPRTGAHAFKSFAAAEVAIAKNQRPGAYQVKDIK